MEERVEGSGDAVAAAAGHGVTRSNPWKVRSYEETEPVDPALQTGARVASAAGAQVDAEEGGSRTRSAAATRSRPSGVEALSAEECDYAAGRLAEAKRAVYEEVLSPCEGVYPVDVIVGSFDDWDSLEAEVSTDLRAENYDEAYVDKCFSAWTREERGEGKNLAKLKLTQEGGGTRDVMKEWKREHLERYDAIFRLCVQMQEQFAAANADMRNQSVQSVQRMAAAHGMLMARCSVVADASTSTLYYMGRCLLGWMAAKTLMRECWEALKEMDKAEGDVGMSGEVGTSELGNGAGPRAPWRTRKKAHGVARTVLTVWHRSHVGRSDTLVLDRRNSAVAVRALELAQADLVFSMDDASLCGTMPETAWRTVPSGGGVPAVRARTAGREVGVRDGEEYEDMVKWFVGVLDAVKPAQGKGGRRHF